MSNILSIFRRDFAAYFTSPIGYIFIMVFATLSVGLYITPFFAFPVADMRPYFENLPLLLCVFIPAVTMRVWAEERKENTWELLLTFPMQAYQLVLGKFLAALAFYALALAATVTLPAMLFSLGNPDPGAVFGGYLGALLLGAMFLAMGIFFSGFFKDQIVAFVVTLLACMLVFMLGNDFIASVIDASVPGLGALLADIVGLTVHFNAFPRGVVDFADVLYFAVWIVLFLFLNILYIDGRNRPGARATFAAAVSICLAIGFLFNFLMTGFSLARLDLTQDKIYTVSEASTRILRDIDTPVQVTLYISRRDKMPTQLRGLEGDITGKLEELRVASGNMIQYKTAYLDAANVLAGAGEVQFGEDGEPIGEDASEQRLLQKGVQPFSVQAMAEDEVTSRVIYASLGIAYRDRPEEVINQIMPQLLPELEYRIVSTVYKLTRDDAPVVALVAPTEAVHIPPEMRQLYMQMGMEIPSTEDPYRFIQQLLEVEKYDVRRVELTKDSPLPDDYDTLAVINPRQLNERQRWEIARALHEGKNVVMAIQNKQWDYNVTGNRINASPRPEEPGVNPLLEEFGLAVNEEILMDVNKVTLRIQTNTLADMFTGGQPIDAPTHILVHNTGMSEDSAITNRLSTVFYLWGSSIDIDQDKVRELGLDLEVLMRSSPDSWLVPEELLTFAEPPADERAARPLMVLARGQFPDPFEGQERPAWPEPMQQPGQPPMPDLDADEPPAGPASPAPGSLLLVGCSQMFHQNFMQAGNLDLFLNMVDGVTLSEDLARVRSRKPVDRTIDRPTPAERRMWRMANYGLANVIIASIGIGLMLARKRARNQYTVQFLNQRND